ncbi:RluA family pseudouridine synthase [Rhodocista pekingensis]|uniref:RluA family pseudouridine synthase n=1 Tax=Rhodocista pekingensis TaxID=201185 RepID=A0ABW2KQ80_9PROT
MPYTAGEIRARVLHRDADVLILDKPHGLSVHYGTKTVEHLEQYLPWVAFEREEPPRLAHRLDKDTSGCLVLARDAEVAARLGRLFLHGHVGKTYWAVVLGRPPGEAGRIDLPLLKVQIPGCSKVVVDPDGKPALTDWRLLATDGRLSWLELTPRTGRMHQLRAHCACSGFPILGDPIYGAEQPPPVPLHLHARSVSFRLGAADSPPVAATAPPPRHMAATLARIAGEAAPAPGCYDGDRTALSETAL